jgi:DNA recombination protein RmuC
VGAEPLFVAALVVLLGIVLWLLATTRREIGELRRAAMPSDTVTTLLQRQIEAVRSEGREGQDVVRREVGELALRMKDDIGGLQQSVATELKSVTTEVTRQLQEGMKLIQSAQTTMGDRLDRAAKVVGEVQGSLGKLGEATQRVVEVGKDIQGLEQILKSPKVRGGLGETLLAELLSQMLPQDHYTLQHPFRSGEKVDAVIRIGERLVAVDAKFPLENFRRMLGEVEEDKRRPLRRQFVRDVKTRIDEIAKKYILPDENTFDFALMYVPAENVYYEIIIKDEADPGDEPIATYALSKRVVPVSPNSFYAYLQVIILGLRGLRIEANAREIQNDLARVAGDLEKVREPLRTLGRHLGNAQSQFTEAERALDRFGTKLEAIERKGGGDQAELPGTRQ